jgi:hypothetical protein
MELRNIAFVLFLLFGVVASFSVWWWLCEHHCGITTRLQGATPQPQL